MARKTKSRLELRDEVAAAERAETKTKKKAVKKKTPVKRKSRKKAAVEVRLKAFWGVFNQSMKRVAVFEYNERKQADKKATDLSKGQRAPHFVQLVKEVIQD